MSYETYGLNDTIKQIQREMAIIRESIPISGEFVGLDQSGHGLGSTSDNVPIIEGITSWQPLEVTLEGSPEDQLQIGATTLIVNGTGNSLTLKTILGTQHNGQIVTIKPKEGKTLDIVSGGNIDVSSTVSLSDNEYVIFQYFEDAGNKYLVLEAGGGSGSSGANTTLSNLSAGNVLLNTDINMNTFDITQICRLEFDQGGQTISNSVAGIDASGDKIRFNVPTNDYFEFTINGDNWFAITKYALEFDTQVGYTSGNGKLWFDGTHLKCRTNNSTKSLSDLGGSTSFSGFQADATLDMNDKNVTDVNALEINSVSANSNISLSIFGAVSAGVINLIDDNDYFAIQVDGTSKFRIYDDEIEFRENITTDTANTCDIGTGSKWFSHGYLNQLTIMGNTSPAFWVAGGQSTFGGYIAIDGRVSATGSIGKLGATSVNDVIGLSTKCWYYGGSSTAYKLGTKGTMTIPELYNNSEPSTPDLDGWFGNADGCIGIMRTYSTCRFYAKSGGAWRYDTLLSGNE